jgi:glycosyltransferase involved in cell wall biosynthesis
MHILIIAGNTRSLIANRGDLIKEMKRRGHQVTALVPEYDFMPEIEQLAIPYRKISLSRSTVNPLAEMRSRKELERIIREIAPDKVFAYTIKPVVQGVPAARQAGVKQVYAMITGMGYLFTGETLRQRILRFIAVQLYRRALNKCTGIFFQNPDDIALFSDLGIVSEDDCRIWMTNGSGVNMGHFSGSYVDEGREMGSSGDGESSGENAPDLPTTRPPNRTEQRLKTLELPSEFGNKSLNLSIPLPPDWPNQRSENPNKPIRFLVIARLLKDKGIMEFVKAAEELKATYEEGVKFTVVGPYDPNLPHAVRREDYDAWMKGDVVEFMGQQSDVRPFIADCDVYVLPSYREGTPRSVLEAMAMGKAVVTTDTPGCRETVNEGENGFLVPAREWKPLFEALECFVNQPELIAQMGVKSYQLCEEKYEVGKVNEGIVKTMGL